MALKFKIKSKDEIPAEQQGLYVERNGAWVLDAEDGVERGTLEEVRAEKAAALKELEDFRARYEGIDPASVKSLLAEKAKLEEAQQLKAGETEKVFENRLRSAKGEWDKQFSAVVCERDALNSRLASIQIDQAVVSEATRRGLRPTAIPDITSRARNSFKLVKGVPQAFEADGQTVRVGKDGMAPLTLAEWIDAQVSEAPHLFEASAGGGAASSGAGGAGGGRPANNPWRKETWNVTEQMRVFKADPGLAARMKAAAAGK